MARPKGSGINTVTRKRPDGTVLRYYYDRETRAFLGHDRGAAEQRVAKGQGAATRGVHPDDRSLGALITLYIGSKAFTGLADSTRATYRRDLDWMRQEYGDLPVRGFKPSTILRIRMLLEHQPSKANKTMAMFSIVLGLGRRLDWIPENPALRAGRVEQLPRTELWSPEDEERFMRGAKWELQLAMMLLLYTVQRPSDMLAMSLAQVTERGGRLWIGLRQRKTKALVDVPVHARLEPLLRDRMARRIVRQDKKDGEVVSTLLVPSPKGFNWLYRNFARSWDAQQRRAALRLARELLATGMAKDEVRTELRDRHRQRRDMRRTGIVRLAEVGATTPQIAAISGHAIDYCQRIIDTYLPRRSEVALGGIEAWERQERQPSKVVRIAQRRRGT